MTGPSTAFDGLYFTTGAVSAMKVILTGGTAVVLIMAQPWLEKNKLYAGEFYMLRKFPNITHAVINDINSHLVTAYRVIKEHPDELTRRLSGLEQNATEKLSNMILAIPCGQAL